MPSLKKFLGSVTVVAGLLLGNSTQAQGIPVIDASSLAQQIQQVSSWVKQYSQMAQQLQNLTGVRGMAGLANNPAARQYLPVEYQTLLKEGVGQWAQIRDAAKKFDVAATSLSATSDAAQAFNQMAKQTAINRASAELAYSTASARFNDIQILLDKVNDAPDAKDIADLQGRIQAEQVMMQNEANKLQVLAQLSQAQRDLQIQQAREISMKASKGGLPSGW